jgi:hypothetical protein
MNLFQWLAVPILALLFLRVVARLVRGERPRWWLLLSAAIWLTAAVTVSWPDLTTRVARVLGIGRGADLVSYVVAILFVVSFFFLYQRYRKLESELTRLVRRLAIEEAEKEEKAESREPPEPPRTS